MAAGQLSDPSLKQPNPQGKGCVSVLQDWNQLRPQVPARKAPADLLRDYCLSALVLAAQFRFRPVPGRVYHLFCTQQEWQLSLIGPQEWGRSPPGEFVAHCCLREDMTWHLEFAELADDSQVVARLQAFVEGFSHTISGQDSLAEGLPFYVAGLPYYQRMLATGLAVSLQHSIAATDSRALRHSLPSLSLGMR